MPLISMEGVSQDVRQVNIGPRFSLDRRAFFRLVQKKGPCLGWGSNPRRAEAKARPSQHAVLYCTSAFCASLFVGDFCILESKTALLTNF